MTEKIESQRFYQPDIQICWLMELEIAVGMATNIPPHNLGEVINATLALIENPDLTSENLVEFVPAPIFQQEA